MQYCPKCKTEMPNDINFCYNCGNKLKAIIPPRKRDFSFFKSFSTFVTLLGVFGFFTYLCHLAVLQQRPQPYPPHRCVWCDYTTELFVISVIVIVAGAIGLYFSIKFRGKS
jgi:hypothetical protein